MSHYFVPDISSSSRSDFDSHGKLYRPTSNKVRWEISMSGMATFWPFALGRATLVFKRDSKRTSFCREIIAKFLGVN
jgi:hypothetical protein